MNANVRWLGNSEVRWLGAPPPSCMLDFAFATCYAGAGASAQQVPECQSLDAVPRARCLAYYTDLIASQRCPCAGMTTPVKPASWTEVPNPTPGQPNPLNIQPTPAAAPQSSNTGLIVGGIVIAVIAVAAIALR